MNVPLIITYENVEKSDAIEKLVRDKVSKLEKVCNYMSSCRVIIEQQNRSKHSANPYRVSINITVPPGHEMAAQDISKEGFHEEPLPAVIRHAFDAARRQLQELCDRERRQVKVHPEQQTQALVEKLLRDENYGFLRTLDGRSVYFHKNSVLHDEWERLRIGTGVRYNEELGENGLQASSVEIVDKPGARIQES